MAYTQEKKDECFDWIIENIESGKSLRWCLETNGMPSSQTFYKWIDERKEDGELTEDADDKSKRYACACETRELRILDEILLIADDQEGDIYLHPETGAEMTNHNVIQRSHVRIDARKWVLSKLNPPKYGNKTDITTNGKEVKANVIMTIDPLKQDDEGNDSPA